MKLLDKIIKQEDIDPGISSAEAGLLWADLVARYDTTELIHFILNFAKDLDFKLLIQNALNNLVYPQIRELEKALDHYRIPFPSRPPKIQNLPANLESLRDEFLFKLIMDGSQTALNIHTNAIKICINDSLRNLYMNFLNQELKLYDALVKYGKVKGWISNAPIYNNN